jgi:hypothetical protein
MTDAIRVENSTDVDVTEWNMADELNLDEWLSKTIGKMLDDNPPILQIPVVNEIADPLTIHICIPLTNDVWDGPTWSISLADVLKPYLDDAREDGSYSKGLSRLADALDGLSKTIRETLAAPP